MIKKLTTLLFIIIFALGIFFRFYKLGITPTGLYLDEASIGYNAFSILNTGRDEYGKSFPLRFRSVGDFKTPIYVYLTVPSVAIFGLTPLAVRLPSAIFGFFTLPLLYLLIKKLVSNKNSKSIALLSTFFLAISPWHIILSRTAYESTVAFFFLLSAVYILLISLEKPKLYLLSAVLFGLSFISYHAERLLAPVVLFSLLVYYRKQIFSSFKKKVPIFVLSLFLGMSIVGSTVFLMRSPGFLKRAGTLNIFSYSNQMPYGYSNKLSGIINNKYLLSTKEFASLYVSYFSPRYLFSLGDSSPRSSYPGLGTFFVWQFPLYFLGLYALFKDKNIRNLKHFILTLLLLSPIPAALTRDPYSTIRALPMLVPLVVILSLGAGKLLEFTTHFSWKLLMIVIGTIISLSLSKLFVSIFYYNDYFRYREWNYGWQQVVATIPQLNPKLPIVIDSPRGEPYINTLFFLKYDPSTYQKDNFEVTSQEYYNNLNRNLVKNLGNITVRKIAWGKDTDHVEQYLIGDTTTISDLELQNHRLEKISDILNPDGTVGLRIVKTNPLK
jgi:4-amino-4-deoxy-L-arabinose transferase-like glycosyltransferase